MSPERKTGGEVFERARQNLERGEDCCSEEQTDSPVPYAPIGVKGDVISHTVMKNKENEQFILREDKSFFEEEKRKQKNNNNNLM